MGEDEQIWHGGFVRFLDGRVRVFVREGHLAPVTKAFKHFFAGKLVRLKPYNCPPLLLTPNHEVLLSRILQSLTAFSKFAPMAGRKGTTLSCPSEPSVVRKSSWMSLPSWRLLRDKQGHLSGGAILARNWQNFLHFPEHRKSWHRSLATILLTSTNEGQT